ncbi:MAG TPA: acyl-CoA dehydrogenase family protein [Solirubrobacteraceae bacterium]|jgi:hypothetical protein|nr:acyl-CoA dehydrogenase family protein [Solirubrobacteraceae bacterium]
MPPTHHPLLAEDRRPLVEEVRRLASEQLGDPRLPARDREGEFWREGWRRCAAIGLCGLPVPVELGGLGADRVTTAATLEVVGYECADAGLLFSLNAHLWSAVIPLWQFGSPAQRERYLTRLCRGDWIGLHAMTEPDSGSDAFSLATVARRDADGYVIRGRKTLITNASEASLFVVFARTPGSEGPLGVSPFLIEAGTKGLTVTSPIAKLGLRTSPLAEIVLDDVRVRSDGVLGREGRGARVFAASMQWERLLIMSCQLGALQRSLEEAVAHARRLRESGTPIVEIDAVSEKLVDVHIGLATARALMYETAWRYDQGSNGPGPAAAVKLVAAETTLRATLALLQVHGDQGYTGELPFERRLRDAIGGRLYSGTSELMRRIVARDMGL